MKSSLNSLASQAWKDTLKPTLYQLEMVLHFKLTSLEEYGDNIHCEYIKKRQQTSTEAAKQSKRMV